ncbi:MAG: biopolymer transporter ExbD [Bacteroidota bacterium]
MNIRARRNRESAEVSTESLNDIMFFLLLFFLILSTLVNPSVIKVNLPTSKTDQVMEMKPVPLTVTKDHQYYIYNRLVQLGDLEAAILDAVKDMKEPALILHFDYSLTAQDIVDVLQIGAKLKVKMSIGTKPPNA